jgi:DNA-binding GntR family transcriptional regulator
MTASPGARPQFQTKEESIYAILRAQIMACERKPGEKIVIDQVSQELGVSSIPVRAAIQRLSMEGLVVVTPHSPAEITEITPAMIRETFALLAVLEAAAFEQAARHPAPALLDSLARLIDEMAAALAAGEHQLWARKNAAFHRRLAEASGMPLLIEFTQRTLDQWYRLRRYYFDDVEGGHMPQVQMEHRTILTLIQEGETAKLKDLAVQHNQAALSAYQALRAAQDPRKEDKKA